MVFYGRLSKACQRCRDRRLKCDLCEPSCSPCNRAGVLCTGYRDIQQLRIRDESQAVRRRVTLRPNISRPPKLHSFLPSLESRARDAFFVHHVTGTGTASTWDFLMKFYDQTKTPEHLTLSIDAVSLAYLAHEVYSDVALTEARERYGSALRKTNQVLQSSDVALRGPTLLASLLLDLFEKLTNNQSRYDSPWASHIKGALALVRLQGLEHFHDRSSMRVLVRLGTNLLISCIVSQDPIPEELVILRAHAGKLSNLQDPKWRLTGLMMQYANLQSKLRRGCLFVVERIRLCLELDSKLQALASEMPSSWQYRTIIAGDKSERIYGHYFHVYPDRHVTQTWNVLRLTRILLNEFLITYCETFAVDRLLVEPTSRNIETLAYEICASVPQYFRCTRADLDQAATRADCGELETVCHARNHGHTHSPSQISDCYTLIFPLYVTGRSSSSPKSLKPWVIHQLDYMGDHFGIRNAAMVGRVLEREADINPWVVYAMLGSYAFAT